MSNSAKRLAQFALCFFVFGVAALICAGSIIAWASTSQDWLFLVFSATLSGAATALASWILFTSAGRTVKIWKGAVTGVFAGSISHYFAWYLAMLFMYLRGTVSWDGSRTVNPIEAIPASLMLSVFSLLLVGWITVPIGAIVGAMFAWFVNRFLK